MDDLRPTYRVIARYGCQSREKVKRCAEMRNAKPILPGNRRKRGRKERFVIAIRSKSSV